MRRPSQLGGGAPRRLRAAQEAAAALQPFNSVKPCRPGAERERWVHEPRCRAVPPRRDTVIYSAVCPKMGGRRVAVKVYDKQKVQPTKYRAIKREIAMMMYFTNKRRGGQAGRAGGRAG